MVIKAILFDLGGVIVNIDFSNFNNVVMSSIPVPRDQMTLNQEYSQLSDLYHRGEITDKKFYNQICNSFEIDKNHLTQSIFFNAYNSIILDFNLDVLEILEKLKYKKKYKLICLSNINSSHFNLLKKKNWKFIKYFDELIFSHEVHLTKPNLDIFKLSIQKADCPAQEILLIDDGLDNIESARKLGIIGIHYKNPKDLIKKLKELGIELLVSN